MILYEDGVKDGIQDVEEGILEMGKYIGEQ